jgi:hypothetical protein
MRIVDALACLAARIGDAVACLAPRIVDALTRLAARIVDAAAWALGVRHRPGSQAASSRNCSWALCLAIFLSLAAPCPAQSGPAILLSPPGSQEPSIAAAPNGDCAVAWVRLRPDGTPDSLELRRRVKGVWSPVETPCPARPNVLVREPIVRLDSSGNPHLVWVAAQGALTSLEYAFYTGSSWSRFEGQSLLPRLSSLRIEHPVMKILPRNKTTRLGDEVFLAWQERAGSNYCIRVFVIDSKAEVHCAALAGEQSPRYVVYPDFLELPPAKAGGEPRVGVCWYSLDLAEPRVEMRAWDDASREWRLENYPQWTPQELHSLPLVLATAAREPFLVGVDSQERISLLLRPIPPVVLSGKNSSRNRLPRASPPDRGTFGLLWQEETAGGVRLVQAALRPEGSVFSETLASESDLFFPFAPDVALAGNNLLAVYVAKVTSPMDPTGPPLTVWQLPCVVLRETSIPGDAWEAILPETSPKP